MIRNIILFVALLLLNMDVLASPQKWDPQAGFKAWEKGESTGDYSLFKSLLSENFLEFSHPVQPERGVFNGASALEKMNTLIEQRTKNPNKLSFSRIVVFQNKNQYVFSFNSEGTVSGYPYKGWNMIQLSYDQNGKIVSFREYLGDVDPSWFQKNTGGKTK